jgi:hypothetical protein
MAVVCLRGEAMRLKEFAEEPSVRVYDDDILRVMLIPEPPRRGLWVRSPEKFEALAMTITQNGDPEGAAIFDPSDPKQAKAAITAIPAKKMRKLSAERPAELLAVGQGTRLKPGHRAQNAL